jgi:predicted AAA+ superfamily ATPase
MHDDQRRLDRLTTPVLIDEWQHYPSIWDRMRHAVDAGAAPGTFLLAGSSFPQEAPQHSGAGRIVTVRMRPLSLAERPGCRGDRGWRAAAGPVGREGPAGCVGLYCGGVRSG